MSIGSSDRWMVFVDGENFTARGEAIAARENASLKEGSHYKQDAFLWFPESHGITKIFPSWLLGQTAPHASRAYYYTSLHGDQLAIKAARESLRALSFQPEVSAKKKNGRSKRVDITLSKDMLSHAFHSHYDVAVLIAGDEDYTPLVQEVQRCGKNVLLAFFSGEKAGLSDELRLCADHFIDITNEFCRRWRKA